MTSLRWPGGLLARGAAELFPGYFALVMATGAVSIAAHLMSMRWPAWSLLVDGGGAYLLLWLLTLVRILKYPARLRHASAEAFAE